MSCVVTHSLVRKTCEEDVSLNYGCSAKKKKDVKYRDECGR